MLSFCGWNKYILHFHSKVHFRNFCHLCHHIFSDLVTRVTVTRVMFFNLKNSSISMKSPKGNLVLFLDTCLITQCLYAPKLPTNIHFLQSFVVTLVTKSFDGLILEEFVGFWRQKLKYSCRKRCTTWKVIFKGNISHTICFWEGEPSISFCCF